MTATASVHHVQHRSVSIIGLLMLMSVVLFFGSLFWMFSGQHMFLVQIPAVLLSFGLLMVTGILYVINPPKQMGAVLLTLIFFTLDMTVRQGLVQGGGADAQSVVKGLIGVFLFGFGLFNGLRKVFAHPILGLFFIYAGYACLSATYSSTVLLGLGSGLTLLGIVFVAAKASTEDREGLQRLWMYIYIATVVAAVVSLAMLAFIPLYARDLADPGSFRLRGITGSANSLGPMVAVGFLISRMMARWAPTRGKRWMHYFFGAALAAALILTNSRASLLGLSGALLLSFFIVNQMSIIGVLLILMAGTMALAVALQPDLLKSVMGLVADLFSRSGSVQELTTLTGRSSIWEACWGLIKEKPLFGYGLGSVRVEIPKVFYDQYGNSAATAHNFVLESLISVGLVGTVPLVMLLVAVTAGLWRYVGKGVKDHGLDAHDSGMALCAFQVMTMFWIQSLVERVFSGTASPSAVCLGLCVATSVYLLRNKPRALRHNKSGLYTAHSPLRSA